MKDFRELKVRQKAHALVRDVYRVTRAFPSDERFGLTSQVRRSAVSLPSNIAEGCGRGTSRELSRFLTIAAGSLSECEYQLLLSRDLEYLDGKVADVMDENAKEVRKMLHALIQYHDSNPKT